MASLKKQDVLYPELSYAILNAAYEVHNQLGPGFVEKLYEEALCLELETRQIPFQRQRLVEITYKNRVIGQHRLDLVVADSVILELKAVTAINDIFRQQVLSYLKATNLRLGILLNFGTSRVETERIVN